MAGLGAASAGLPGLLADQPGAGPYQRANTDWLAGCRYGVGVHWTAQSVPRHGPPLPFQKAVDAFRVDEFVERLVYAGAEYLLFTSTHALQMLPAPNPVIDKILPGRTCKRDLIGELVNLKTPPTSRFLPNGLQWFGWTCLEDRAWVHHKLDREIPKPLYADEEVVSYVRTCNSHQAPMTFNVGIYQDGTMAPASVEQLHRLGAALGKR